ncbi:MAG: hypothetical protein AAF447_10810 [Myxococcota bacterium]
MKDITPRERWDVWMVQAQRFAQRENFIDALGRIRHVLQEVDAALPTLGDAEAKRLARFRDRVARRETKIRADFEAWNGAIAARRQASTADAEAEMSRPLPYGPGEIY